MSLIDSIKKNIMINKMAFKVFVEAKLALKKVEIAPPIQEPITVDSISMREIDTLIAELDDEKIGKGELDEAQLDSIVGGNTLASVQSGTLATPGAGDLEATWPSFPPDIQEVSPDDEDTLKLFGENNGFFSPGDIGTQEQVADTPNFDEDMFSEKKYAVEENLKEKEEIGFEFKLGTDVSPEFQPSFFTPPPISAGPSILDNSIAELESMDMNELRSQLLDELRALENVDPEYRKIQLQKIFSRLFDFQPSRPMSMSGNEYQESEQRFYADLISTPGLSEIPYVREFLEKDFYGGNPIRCQQARLLEKIFNYYDTHSKEAIDNFNYIFRSSDAVAYHLFTNPIYLDDYFNEHAMTSFGKEDLSQLFRFYFINDHSREILKNLFSEEHHKSLFILSQLTKKVNSEIGHSSEFLEAALQLFNSNYGFNSFTTLLNDVYDFFIKIPEDEAAFATTLANNSDVIVFRELINYIILSKYDSSIPSKLFKESTSINGFLKAVHTYREGYHRIVLGKDGKDKVNDSTFNPNTDFKPIQSYDDLEHFKQAVLYNLYGISVKEAEHLKEHYGRFMDVLLQGLPPRTEGMSDEEYLASLDESKMTIMKKDLKTLEVFRAILAINDLDIRDPQFADKLRIVQNAYYIQMREKGFDHQSSVASAVVVEGLLNNMFMNTYNKRLLKINESHNVIRVDNGVTLLDAGIEFDMILTSLSGVGDFYDHQANMASKWNTAALSRGQGVCTSHISSQNLGVIDLDTPLLGFSRLPGMALNSMGTSDIYTSITQFNLRASNDSREGKNRFFIPGNIMSSQTRFGYNEILLDRFMMQDEKGQMKLQPDYLVFFKMSDNDYTMNQVYQKTLKTARDFGVPVMVVDIPKIKKHEKEEIKKMEDQLFSSETVDHKLMEDIVTRYMNNYTGSLTIVGNNSCGWNYGEDFSVGGMRNFFNQVLKNISEIEDEDLKRQWLEALEDVYRLEKKKYKEATSVGSWGSSVTEFILDEKYDLKTKLSMARAQIEQRKQVGITDSYFEDDQYKTAELPKVDIEPEVGKEDDGWENVSSPSWEEVEEITDKLPVIDPNSLPYVALDSGDKGIFVTDVSYSPEAKTIVELVNYLGDGTKFEIIGMFEHLETMGTLIIPRETEDSEMLLVENLVASYFFEETELAVVVEMAGTLNADATFASTENYDFNEAIMRSPYKDVLDPNGNDEHIPLNPAKLQPYVEKIENMSEENFLKIFSPVITSTAKKTGESFEIIAERLLEKKSSIGTVFAKLQVQADNLKAGNGSITGSEDAITSGEDSRKR